MAETHAGPRANYLGVFIILAVFTLVETAVSYVQAAEVRVPVLVTLSIAKAVLVLLYFMHLKFDSKLFSYLFIAGCILVIPLILVMAFVMPVIARY